MRVDVFSRRSEDLAKYNSLAENVGKGLQVDINTPGGVVSGGGFRLICRPRPPLKGETFANLATLTFASVREIAGYDTLELVTRRFPRPDPSEGLSQGKFKRETVYRRVSLFSEGLFPTEDLTTSVVEDPLDDSGISLMPPITVFDGDPSRLRANVTNYLEEMRERLVGW